jgi:hypothetical protein
MRVNIQFSVEAEDIPDRIISFVKEAEAMIEVLHDSEFFFETKECIDDKNILKAIERLARVRDQLSNIDFRLDDCMTILGGYQKLLMGEEIPPHAESEHET